MVNTSPCFRGTGCSKPAPFSFVGFTALKLVRTAWKSNTNVSDLLRWRRQCTFQWNISLSPPCSRWSRFCSARWTPRAAACGCYILCSWGETQGQCHTKHTEICWTIRAFPKTLVSNGISSTMSLTGRKLTTYVFLNWQKIAAHTSQHQRTEIIKTVKYPNCEKSRSQQAETRLQHSCCYGITCFQIFLRLVEYFQTKSAVKVILRLTFLIWDCKQVTGLLVSPAEPLLPS